MSNLSVIPSVEKDLFNFSKFIDFDKEKKVFYNNFYINDYDFVIKIPLFDEKHHYDKILIEKFNLAKFTYLLSYE